MIDSNRISVVIPHEVAEQAKQLYFQANQLLAPYLISLTQDEKSRLPKMEDKLIPFVTKGADYIKIPGTPIPPFVAVNELEVDLSAFRTLRQIRQIAQPTLDMIDDTMLLCGSESYIAVLAFYTHMKRAAKMNISGTKTIFDDLNSCFPIKTIKEEKVV